MIFIYKRKINNNNEQKITVLLKRKLKEVFKESVSLYFTLSCLHVKLVNYSNLKKKLKLLRTSFTCYESKVSMLENSVYYV